MNQDSQFVSELKFVLDPVTASLVQEWASCNLEPDPYAAIGRDSYRTTSLYFDTEDFDMFFRRRSYARAKFRIRNYNGSPSVFFERKMKTHKGVMKSRSEAAISDMSKVLDDSTQWSGRWFARRLRHRHLRPVCQIRYLRTAHVSTSSTGPLRLTMDQHLRAVAIDEVAFTNSTAVDILPNAHILELKYRMHVPLVFKQLIEEFKLAPQPVSKYRLAGAALAFNGIDERSACLSS